MRAWFFHELRVVPREYILPSLYIFYRGGFLLDNIVVFHIFIQIIIVESFCSYKYGFTILCYIHVV